MIDSLCKVILDRLNINKFIETGSFEGETVAEVARWFAELHPEFGKIEKLILTGAQGLNPWNTRIAYPIFEKANRAGYQIFSTEVDRERYERLKPLWATCENIILANKSSEAFLRQMIDEGELSDADRCFFYLDAHWNDYWPLRDEITQIRRLKRFVISIDDFMVPGRPEFGYDSYGSRVCNWGYIADLFAGLEAKAYYPLRSNRDNRGWIVIFGGYRAEELRFMRDLPLVQADTEHSANAIVQGSINARSNLNWRYHLGRRLPPPLLRFLLKITGRGPKPLPPPPAV